MINTRTIALADIAPNTGQIPGVPANPRIIQDGRFTKLVRSLKDDPEMMELRELLVYEQDGTFVVVGGNMRLKALKHIGATEAPCKVIPADWPAEKLRAIATKDNVSFGEFDWDALVEGWDKGELEDWGVDFPAIAKPKKGLTDPDAVPDAPKQAVSVLGDVWLLGDHRIICGDSTKAEVVSAVMAGEKAALILADPPYFEKVEEEWDQDFDGFHGFLDFLRQLLGTWAPMMLDRGTSAWWCAPDFAWHVEGLIREHFAVFNHIVWYKGKSLGTTVSVEDMRRWRPRSERLLLCEKLHSPDALLASFNAKTSHIAARSAYASIIDRMIAWREASGLSPKEIDKALGKNGMAGHYFGRSQWMLPHEEAWDILRKLFGTKGVDIGPYSAQRAEFDAQRAEFDAQRAEFDAQRREFDAQLRENLTDVWEAPAPHGQERFGHSTPKPVSMYEKIVAAHSRPADIVADPFSGTAPTVIACEILSRKCRAIELAPEYVDVAVKRWQEFTGKQATHAVTGETFAQRAEAQAITA